MIKRFLLFTFLISSHAICSAQSGKIYFIPTLHGIHKSNLNYNYDSLKRIVNSLNPDIIAVEIRSEDLGQDSGYLAKNYPYEMRMMKYWFPQVIVMGFDWLGEDIEGKLIPSNYWKEISPIKQYERALNADTVFESRTSYCDSFTQRRINILKQASLRELLNSEDAILTKSFYDCLRYELKGSIHERVLRFYDIRNEKILNNIKRIVTQNPGKTIVILTGDDHFVMLKNRFKHTDIFSAQPRL